MPKLLMLRGLPASGKSTFAKHTVIQNPGWKRINKDLLREMLDGGHWSKQNEAEILSVRDRLVSDYLQRGINVIVDDTNLAPKHEARLRQLADERGAEFEIKDFDTDIEECIKRDNARANGVGEAVIKRMARERKSATQSFKQALEDDLPEAFICDLDGTLAIMDGHRSPYDASTCEQDPLNGPIAFIVRTFQDYGLKTVFMSGRDERYRAQTWRWLMKHGFDPRSELFMRPEGDIRKDSVVKEEMVRGLEGRLFIRFVLDDRDQVVEMWRSLGLTCLQVAPGDF